MGMIHTCYRIGDIDKSLTFYKSLGFEEVRRLDLKDGATNIFIQIPGDTNQLELTKNPGVDSYDIGTGYGHVAITTPDMDKTLAELKTQGINPEKPPYSVREGGSRICFVRDPDNYRIEIIEKSD